MKHPEEHHHKMDQPAPREMKLLAAPKEEVKFQTPENEKIDNFIQDVAREVSLIEKQVSKQTFWITHLMILVFGVIFSLGFLFVVNGNQFFLPDTKTVAPFQTITKAPTSFNLDITSPEDNFLSFDNTVVISGKTVPKATVVISGNSQDVVTEANNFGDFSKVVNLDSGLNEISINSFDSQGNTKEDKLVVYYSEEEI